MFFILSILLSFTQTICNEPIEQVISFHVDIKINADRTLKVCETITLYSLGNIVIFRTVPDNYVFTHIKKDGHQCPFFIKQQKYNLQSIFVDSKDTTVLGKHTYSISYTTPKKIRSFFENTNNEHTHDTLEWEIISKHWEIPIKEISVSLYLPHNADKNLITCKTNLGNSMLQNSSDNTAYTFFSNSFIPNKAATFSAQWQPGIVNQPSQTEKYLSLIKIWLSMFTFLATLLFVLLHCFRLLARLFTLFTQWRYFYTKSDTTQEIPPADMLPAETCYLDHDKLYTNGLTGTLIDMAQRNYFIIQINDADLNFLDNPYVLIKQNTNDTTPLYQDIADILFETNDNLLLTKNNKELKKTINTIKMYCKNKNYFKQESAIIPIVMIICSIIVIGTFLLTFMTSNLFHHDIDYLNVVYCIIVLLCGYWTIRLNTMYTQKGAILYKELKSFKHFLTSQIKLWNESSDVDQNNQLYNENLAYIFALNTTKNLPPDYPLPYWYQDHTDDDPYDLSDAMTELNVILILLVPQLEPISRKLRNKYRSRNLFIRWWKKLS